MTLFNPWVTAVTASITDALDSPDALDALVDGSDSLYCIPLRRGFTPSVISDTLEARNGSVRIAAFDKLDTLEARLY